MNFSRSEFTNFSSAHDTPFKGALKELAAPGYFTGKPPALIEAQQITALPDIELDIEDTQLLMSAKKQAPYRKYVLVRDMLDPDLDYESVHTHAHYVREQQNPFAPQNMLHETGNVVAEIDDQEVKDTESSQYDMGKIIIPQPSTIRRVGEEALSLMGAAKSL